MKIRSIFFKALICVFALVYLPASNAVVIGSPASSGTGNCFPFGCTGWQSTYQQVYGSSNFASAFTINSLSFYHTEIGPSAQFPALGTYTISLSTTLAAVDGLSLNPVNNIGLDNTTVFVGALPTPVPFGTQMNLILSTPFMYDPNMGNLLMSVTALDVSQPSQIMYFDVNTSALDQMSRLGRGGENNAFVDWAGLVTGFNEVEISVPEPGTIALLGLGLAGLGFTRRKKS